MGELPGFDDTLLRGRSFAPAAARVAPGEGLPEALHAALGTLARLRHEMPGLGAFLAAGGAMAAAEAIRAELDRMLTAQVNAILHHAEFQALESGWRGLHFLVRRTQSDAMLKIRVLDVGKRELSRTLRKFRGNAWDQSPVFKRIYEEEFGQFGGEPFGLLVGDYHFDHHPEDVQLLSAMARIAAASHCPFVAGAAPSVMQMESWRELANPRDLTKIFGTPEYAAWRALRTEEDSRYLALCMPHILARLPYGERTDPLDDWAFEETADGADAERFLWLNAAFAFAANVTRAFAQYGWCTRIRGVESGGLVEDLLSCPFPSADGDTDRRCVTEVSLSERREAELSRAGFVPLLHRKNTDFAAFVSAQSLQLPAVYADGDATANAAMSARLPYLLACCRFAHYLKCMVRDKVGSTLSRQQLTEWLEGWLLEYIDGSPASSSEEWKATHPLAQAEVALADKEGAPGQYEARFMLRPHYQLEGMGVSLRLVSRLAG